jgi:antitoxin (DNA-binding transcriptional repressor) of toxin-antitoxin stability system
MAKQSKFLIHHIPITKARINLGQVVRRAHLNKECFIVEKDGIPVAGIIGVDELEDYLELQDPTLKEQIKAGHASYQQGEGRNLDELLNKLKNKAEKQKTL